MKRIFTLLAPLTLAACMAHPTDQSGRKLTLSDAGPPPENVAVVVHDALRYRLKDIDSAKIEYPITPRPVVFARAYGMNQGGAGWEICPMVNAKNSFGGYTGFKPVFILWNKGEVIDFKFDEMSEFWCRDNNDARVEVGPRLK